MPTYGLAPYEARQYFDDNGDPLDGGLVYTWVSGTSTPLQTFSDAIGTPNTNPIVLSAAGRARIYLLPVAYKFTMTDQFGVPVGLTMDPVTAAASAVGSSAGLGEIFTFGSNSSAGIAQLAYPAGATFDMLQPGSAVFQVDAANLVGTYVLQVTGMMVGVGQLSVSLMDLTSGSPDTPIATATLTSTTGAVATSGPITFGAAGIVRQYGLKTLVTAGTGFLIGASLVRTA
jgi:hypothetical protein